jgi:hypothetical protein
MAQVLEHLPSKWKPWVQTPVLKKKKQDDVKNPWHARSPELISRKQMREWFRGEVKKKISRKQWHFLKEPPFLVLHPKVFPPQHYHQGDAKSILLCPADRLRREVPAEQSAVDKRSCEDTCHGKTKQERQVTRNCVKLINLFFKNYMGQDTS